MTVNAGAVSAAPPGRLGLSAALITVFCISGASGLAYEVLWTRQMTFVLGGSALAVSTILAVFMGGLGLGGFLGGRWADRVKQPLLFYALAEVGIGVFGLLTPMLLSASGDLYLGLHRATGSNPFLATIARAFASCLILLVPTTLMGATLPFMARFFVRRIDHLGRGLGLLYGVNILGGVIGAGYMGYVGVLEHGVRASLFLAAAGNFIAAIGAVVIARLAPGYKAMTSRAEPSVEASPLPQASSASADSASRVPSSSTPAWGDDPSILRLLYIAFAISGFTSLAYQVLWTRMLNFAIGNSVYAFTTILVVVLTGLFLGAFVAGPIADRTRHPFRLLGMIQLLAAAAVVLTLLSAPMLPSITTQLVAKFGSGTQWKDALTKVIPAAILLLAPCFLLGLTFPLALKVATSRLERLGERLGRCYAINTLGAILGSLSAGYVLLSTLGLERSIYLVTALNCLLAALLLRRSESLARPLTIGASVVAAALLLASVVAQPTPFLAHTSAMKKGGRTIVFHREGRTASVAVTKKVDEKGALESTDLHINLLGSSVCDVEYRHQQYYSMISLLPTALHPRPEKVFVAGFASGVTAGVSSLDERTKVMTCVEISPEVIAAAPHFAEYNFDVASNPKARIIADDARAWLATTEERFDIIVTDAFISAVTGTCSLYSVDYFRLCSQRLAPGGIMSVGVGSFQGTDRTVARSFLEAFPYAVCLSVPQRNVYNKAFLIGSNEPLAFDRASIDAAFAQPALQKELARYGVPDAEALIGTYLCDREAIMPFLEKTEICTDDKPVIDFQAISWAEGFVGGLTIEGAGIIRMEAKIGRQPFPFRM